MQLSAIMLGCKRRMWEQRSFSEAGCTGLGLSMKVSCSGKVARGTSLSGSSAGARSASAEIPAGSETDRCSRTPWSSMRCWRRLTRPAILCYGSVNSASHCPVTALTNRSVVLACSALALPSHVGAARIMLSCLYEHCSGRNKLLPAKTERTLQAAQRHHVTMRRRSATGPSK